MSIWVATSRTTRNPRSGPAGSPRRWSSRVRSGSYPRRRIGYLGGGDGINDLGMMLQLARNVVILAMLVDASREMLACFRPTVPDDDSGAVATLK